MTASFGLHVCLSTFSVRGRGGTRESRHRGMRVQRRVGGAAGGPGGPGGGQVTYSPTLSVTAWRFHT